MGQKDLSEKLLEDYNDVFADIVNGLIFKGEQRINPKELRRNNVHSQYKADDAKLHELERDVSKEWVSSKVNIAIYGIENQSIPDKYMPLRILGYDGSSYRSQLLKKNPRPIPVVTIILYFGTEKRWSYSKNLKKLLSIPKGMESFVSDYKVNVFEIAWLTDEELSRFTSDFKVIANFFVQKRKNKNYVPDDPTEIKHLDEVLKLLSVMTGESKYEQIINLPKEQKKGVKTMCSVAENLENIGICKAVYGFVSDGTIAPAVGAKRLGITIRKLKADMQKAGYKYPSK